MSGRVPIDDAARGRWTIPWTALFPVAALIVLALAAQGAFRSRDTLPLVFFLVVCIAGAFGLLIDRRRLRLRLALVLVAALLAAAAVVAHRQALAAARRAAEQQALEALAGARAPAIRVLETLNDPARSVRGELEPGGQATLLNFWATWCTPCREEMPRLERFWQAHRGRLRVVGVTRFYTSADAGDGVRDELAEIERFLDELHVSYPVVIGDVDAFQAYRVVGLPTTVLIDGNGAVLAYGIGLDGFRQVIGQAADRLSLSSATEGRS